MSEELHPLLKDVLAHITTLEEIDRRLKFLDYLEFHNNMKDHKEGFEIEFKRFNELNEQ